MEIYATVENILEAEQKLNEEGYNTSIMDGAIYFDSGYLLYTSRRPYIGKLGDYIFEPSIEDLNFIIQLFERLNINFTLNEKFGHHYKGAKALIVPKLTVTNERWDRK